MYILSKKSNKCKLKIQEQKMKCKNAWQPACTKRAVWLITEGFLRKLVWSI